MIAESSTPQGTTLLLRVHNYNRVSFGALLGACPADLLAAFRIRLWETSEPMPEGLTEGPVLFAYSLLTPILPASLNELAGLRRMQTETQADWTFLAGGPHVTCAPGSARELGFDLVVAGEGEEIFPLLLRRYLEREFPKGVLQMPHGQIDLDRFPGFHEAMGYLPPIEISRGCRFGCAFCAVPRIHRGTLRHRSIPKILEITRTYLRRPNRKRIKFLTPNAFAYGSDGREPNLAALRALLTGLKEVGVPEIKFGSFPGEVRPDFVTREVMDLVTPFLANHTIVMGIQSGSDRLLRAMGRGHDREQALQAVRLLREYGFTPHVDFIIGLPGETPEEQDQLLDFMEELVATWKVRIHMHTFMPLPGTAWAEHVAGPISPRSRDRLRALERQGVLDGWWENQIGYSRRK